MYQDKICRNYFFNRMINIYDKFEEFKIELTYNIKQLLYNGYSLENITLYHIEDIVLNYIPGVIIIDINDNMIRLNIQDKIYELWIKEIRTLI